MKLWPVMMPWADDMNYGRALNEALSSLPAADEDWVPFLDHDAVFTTRLWNRQIRDAISAAPDAGLFTSCASRIAPRWQMAGTLRESHDIAAHRRFGLERAERVRTLLDVTETKGIGGVLMVINRGVWGQIGGFVDGLNCIDHMAHFAVAAAGRRVYVIEGLYLYHWRRANGDAPPADAPKAANCPCRGPERQPTVRIPIPPRSE